MYCRYTDMFVLQMILSEESCSPAWGTLRGGAGRRLGRAQLCCTLQGQGTQAPGSRDLLRLLQLLAPHNGHTIAIVECIATCQGWVVGGGSVVAVGAVCRRQGRSRGGRGHAPCGSSSVQCGQGRHAPSTSTSTSAMPGTCWHSPSSPSASASPSPRPRPTSARWWGRTTRRTAAWSR